MKAKREVRLLPCPVIAFNVKSLKVKIMLIQDVQEEKLYTVRLRLLDKYCILDRFKKKRGSSILDIIINNHNV